MTRQEIYVMRVWHEGERTAWRVTITDTKNHEKKHFATLESLVRFLQERLEAKGN